MPFKMTHSNFSSLTLFSLLLFGLHSCTQTTNTPKNLNIDTIMKEEKNLAFVDKSIDSLAKTNDTEEKIMDTIFKLKEVKQRANYIDQQTKGKRYLQIWIAHRPNIKQPYYYIQVGEDNGTNFVTHFNFDVYPDSMRIMYFDTKDDKEMTLKEWRKINGM